MWQIIGAGAIGCLWAANLKRSGQDVHLITRRTIANPVLNYQDLQQNKYRFNISSGQQLLNNKDPILVCVKATQVKQAILNQLPYIGENQIIILMHNGMGCAEQVQALLPYNPIICATTANASLVNAPLNIQQTGLGMTYLGAYNHPIAIANSLTSRLNNALDNTYWVENIKQKLWLKLIINICINPLTAIYQINNGKLQAPQYQQQIIKICEEAIKVAQAEGIKFEQQTLFKLINDVINATAENFSSMNRDIFYQRNTENEYINGYLLEKARNYNINTPTIAALYQQIKERENTIADNEK